MILNVALSCEGKTIDIEETDEAGLGATIQSMVDHNKAAGGAFDEVLVRWAEPGEEPA
jgi:hypothetical protein